MISLVVGSIKQLGMEDEQILGGSVSLCQPVHAGISSLLKASSCKDWGYLMLALGMSICVTKPPMRQRIAEEVMMVHNRIAVDVVTHSCRHGS